MSSKSVKSPEQQTRYTEAYSLDRQVLVGLVEKFLMLLKVLWRSVLPLHLNFYLYIVYSPFIMEATSHRKDPQK